VTDALVPLAVLVAGPLTSLCLVAIARLTATDVRPTTRPTTQPTTARLAPIRLESSHG
jgi:hypothetical protein